MFMRTWSQVIGCLVKGSYVTAILSFFTSKYPPNSMLWVGPCVSIWHKPDWTNVESFRLPVRLLVGKYLHNIYTNVCMGTD